MTRTILCAKPAKVLLAAALVPAIVIAATGIALGFAWGLASVPLLAVGFSSSAVDAVAPIATKIAYEIRLGILAGWIGFLCYRDLYHHYPDATGAAT